jgi:hypothetical protein
MRPYSMAVLAVSIFIAGCVSGPAPSAATQRAPVLVRTAPAVALESETRYYTDETGAIWDDRGRRLGPRGTVLPVKP